MSDQKPTGVFIWLPLSREDERKIHDLEPYKKGKERALLAIGTPVADDELKPIAYINAERLKWKIATDNDFILSFSGAPNLGKGTLNLADGIVFYTDHQAALAQCDAEIARLREALVSTRDAITSHLNAKSIVCTVWHSHSETLMDYIDTILHGGAA